jgi:hypothetical protein
VHRTIRALSFERLEHERAWMRTVSMTLPNADRRFVRRVPAQPYVRVDRNDYPIDVSSGVAWRSVP